MSEKEFNKIFNLLKANYFKEFKKMTNSEIKNLFLLWRQQFIDLDYSIVKTGLETFISSSVYALLPMIGDIKRQILKLNLLCEEELYPQTSKKVILEKSTNTILKNKILKDNTNKNVNKKITHQNDEFKDW